MTPDKNDVTAHWIDFCNTDVHPPKIVVSPLKDDLNQLKCCSAFLHLNSLENLATKTYFEDAVLVHLHINIKDFLKILLTLNC